ncbi:MAG: DUF4175 family protein [Balneolaceae bacterium]
MQQQAHIHKKIQKLDEQLTNAARKARRMQGISASLLGAAVALLIIALYVWIETGAFASPGVKSSILSAATLIGIGTAWLVYRKRADHTLQTFADRFLQTRPSDGQQIRNILDLYHHRPESASRFYDAALQENLNRIDAASLGRSADAYVRESGTGQRFRKSIAISGLALFLFAVTGTLQTDSLQRSLAFWESYEKPNPYEFVITPESATVEHGFAFAPTIEFLNGREPQRVVLLFKTDVEEEFRERPLRQAGDTRFESDPIELTSSIDWKLSFDGFQSDEYRMVVQLNPRFDALTATVQPPAYTGLDRQVHSYPFTSIRLLRGSEVELTGTSNKPLAQAELQSRQAVDAPSLSLKEDSRLEVTTRFEPQQDDTLSFALTDTDGLENRNPFRFVLQLTDDEHPVVTIRQPSGTVMESEPSEMDIIYVATDDFGLQTAELRWERRRAFVDEPETGRLSLETPENGVAQAFKWDLEPFALRPRDELRFTIRVRDNDAIAGGKWGESQPVTIQIPSLAEFYESMDERERDVQAEMDRVSEQYEEMQSEYERFLDRLRQNPEGGFEEQELLESVTDQQRQVEEEIQRIQEQFNELQRDIEQNSNVSEETRQAYRELQQLMDELDDPAFREALEELRNALERMSPNEMERALENVSFNEEVYRERLERTRELFKQLKLNSDLNRLADQFDDLSQRIESRDEQTMDELRNEMESSESDLESLSEQLNTLGENPPERAREQIESLREEIRQELDQIMEDMRNLSDQVEQQGDQAPQNGGQQNGEPQEGGEQVPENMQQQQQQISQQLQEQSERLRSSMQQMSGQQLNVNILALQRILFTMLDLSETQERLSENATQTRSQNLGFVDLARTQSYIRNQFSLTADSLFQLSTEIPGLPNRINRKKSEVDRTINRSVDQMAERNQRGATIASRESLGGINDLTSMLANLLDQLMDQDGAGGGGGMSMEQMTEQLRDMSQDQQQLNQMMQQMVNDMQGDRLSRDQMERLDQMARQQNEIRRQLQELQRGGALREGDRTLSELQRMMEDMEDSINDMRGGLLDPIMVERQQNILSRMLSAEESLEQRGEEEQREGTRADPLASEFPPDMTLEELQQEIRTRLQDPSYTRFSDEYRQLIERYFDMLRRMERDPLP